MAALTEARDVYWCDGSDAEYDRLCAQLVAAGTLHEAQSGAAAAQLPGAQQRRATSPGSKTAPSSARERQEDAGPTNNWMAPAEMRALLQTGQPTARRRCFAARCAAARCTSCRSRWGRSARQIAHIGVELTDSAYVAVNMKMMTRMGRKVLDVLGADGHFVPCMHIGRRAAGAGREGRRLALQRHQVHRPLPGDAGDLELRLGLRRQRPARQEVLRPAHRLGDGPGRGRQADGQPGLARRAHADPRRDLARGQETPCRRGVPERLRQDQLRDADPARRHSTAGR